MTVSLKATITYEQDRKRFHRFKVVDPDGNVTGSIYFSKDMKQLPGRLVLERKETK